MRTALSRLADRNYPASLGTALREAFLADFDTRTLQKTFEDALRDIARMAAV